MSIVTQQIEADKAPAVMDRVSGMLDGPYPIMGDIAKAMKQGLRDNFTSSSSPDSGYWQPRKPNPHDDGHPILIDTGRLLQAATGGGPGHIEVIAAAEVTEGVSGSAVPYAAIHNFGGVTKTMPQREYMGLKVEKLDEIEKLIADFVGESIL